MPIKPGDIVYVHGREACVVRQAQDVASFKGDRLYGWWIITIAGKEMLCPEDIMKEAKDVATS